MKMITAIVRTTSLERIVKDLEKIKIRNLTISNVKGIGEQVSLFNPYSIHDMIQIIAPDERVDEIEKIILTCAHTGLAGDGIIFVSPIDSLIKIRTKEKVY